MQVCGANYKYSIVAISKKGNAIVLKTIPGWPSPPRGGTPRWRGCSSWRQRRRCGSPNRGCGPPAPWIQILKNHVLFLNVILSHVSNSNLVSARARGDNVSLRVNIWSKKINCLNSNFFPCMRKTTFPPTLGGMQKQRLFSSWPFPTPRPPSASSRSPPRPPRPRSGPFKSIKNYLGNHCFFPTHSFYFCLRRSPDHWTVDVVVVVGSVAVVVVIDVVIVVVAVVVAAAVVFVVVVVSAGSAIFVFPKSWFFASNLSKTKWQ